MTPDEAIESLKETYDYLYDEGDPIGHKAIKLGIEALEREVRVRDGTPTGGKFRLFPSETEE